MCVYKNLGCFSELLFIPENFFTTWRMVWQETIGAQYGQYSTYFPLKKLATKCFGVFFEALSHILPLFSVCFCNMTHGPLCIYWLLLYRSPTGTVSPSSKARGRGKGGETELLVENTSSGGKVVMKFCSFSMKTRKKMPLYIRIDIYIYKIHCIIYIHIQIHIHMIQCPAAPPPVCWTLRAENTFHFRERLALFEQKTDPVLGKSVTNLEELRHRLWGKWAGDFGKMSHRL